MPVFLTPDEGFTPTHVIHGTTNMVAHLQFSLAAKLPTKLSCELLQWLYDLLLICKSVPDLLDPIERLLDLCSQLSLLLHPDSCLLFASEVRWSERRFSFYGWRFDPQNITALQKVSPPTTEAHL